MPKQNKDSRFDRVLTGKDMARKVMKDMDDPKSPWSKDRAVDMVTRMGSGGIVSSVKGAVSKFASKAKPRVSESAKRFIEDTNRIDEVAKSKGIKRVKTTAGPDKGKSKYTSAKRKNVEALKDKDFKNDFSLGPNSRVSEEFTKRGKPVGKPITDKGGKRVTNRTPQTEETKEALAKSKDERVMKKVDAAKNPKTHKMIDRFSDNHADWGDAYGTGARSGVNKILRRYEKKPKTKIVGEQGWKGSKK